MNHHSEYTNYPKQHRTTVTFTMTFLSTLPTLPAEIVEHIINYARDKCTSCGLSICNLQEGSFQVVLRSHSKCVACSEGKRWDPSGPTGYAFIERLVVIKGLDDRPLGPGKIYRSWQYLEKGKFKGSTKRAARDDRERFQKRCSHRRPPTTLQVVGWTEYNEEIVAHVPSPGRRHDPRKCDRSCAEECRRYVDALKRRPRRRTARLPASA